MGQVELGLCSTHILLDQIRWTKSQPATDRVDDRIGRVGTSIGNRQVGQGQRSGKRRKSDLKQRKSDIKTEKKGPKSSRSLQIQPNLGHFRQDLG